MDKDQNLKASSSTKTRRSVLVPFDPRYVPPLPEENMAGDQSSAQAGCRLASNPDYYENVIIKEDIGTVLSIENYCATSIADRKKLVEEVTTIVDKATRAVENPEHNKWNIVLSIKAVANVSDRVALLEKEKAELKLQLRASQQAQAALEEQLQQKEEVIIKNQAEALREDLAYKQEGQQLREEP